MAYRITVVEGDGRITTQWRQMGVWRGGTDFVLTEPVFSERDVPGQLERLRTDFVCIPAAGRRVEEIRLVKEIRCSGMRVRMVILGDTGEYSQVRQAFLAGAFDYLILPVSEKLLCQSLYRIYENVVDEEIVYRIMPKTEALIENLFSEDGSQVPMICRNLIDTLYLDLEEDELNGQMAADKVKDKVYEELIKRKPWLDKFLYAPIYTYQMGFTAKPKETVVREWIRDFKRVGAVIKKYHMVDHKLVYPSGKYIVVHVEEKLTLEQVASAVFLNKNYLSTIFKKYVGMSFVDFVNEVKVDRAQILLQDPGLKVRDVAAILRYGDAGYFTRIFKQKTGMTPDQYKKSVIYEDFHGYN